MISHLENIVDVLSARSSSEALAYVFLVDGTSESEIRWTFADTASNSHAFAAHLRDQGVSAGDRVVLAVNPSLEYIAALYGIMQLGAIPVPCFPPLRPKELDRFHAITVDSAPKGIVIDGMYRERVEELRIRLKSSNLEPVIVYADQVVVGANDADPVSIKPNDLAVIQYTSGSTGSPKGVCLTHDNLMSNCEALGRSMGHDPDRIGFSWLPPYHDMGLMGTILVSMYQGVPLVLMSPMHFVQSPRRWLEAITDYRATIVVGPNFSLDLCSAALSAEDATGLDLSTVQRFYCGAEPISADTLAQFVEMTAPLGFDPEVLTPCYGMAETTLFVSGKTGGRRYCTDYLPEPSGTGRAVVSCGQVDPEHVVRIVDPTNLVSLDDGRVGEIWVSGRSVAAGYHNRDEQTREAFHARLANGDGEYLRTGDLGFVRSSELFVTGRIKDLIIVNGRNIYPQDVEATTMQANPSLRRAVAFSVLDNSSEHLCVVAEATDREVSAELRLMIAEAIRQSVTSEFGISPHVHICPKRTIPTTTSGKVRRQETRRMFLANELRSLHSEATGAQECTA